MSRNSFARRRDLGPGGVVSTRTAVRTARGQAIAETAAVLGLLTAVFVALVLMYVNAAVVAQYHLKVQMAAAAAAQVYDAEHYFVGSVRQDFDPTVATLNARAVADRILTTLGMPPSSGIQVGTIDVPTVYGSMNSATVTITENGLRTIGNVLPPINISAKGVAWDGYTGARGVVQFNFIPAAAGTNCFIYLPCYGISPDPTGNFSLPNPEGTAGGAGFVNPPYANVSFELENKEQTGSTGVAGTGWIEIISANQFLFPIDQ